jgi:hypothetical protein
MLVSVLLPTRQRPELMLKSVKSLIDRASDPSQIEVLLKIDTNDQDTYTSRYEELQSITPNCKVLISPQKNGYQDLHLAVNDLCALSTGEFLLLWNDDATMETQGWDRYVAEHSNQLCVIQMNNNHFPDIFPLVHRKIYELLNHFSLNPHNDTWIHYVAQVAGIERQDFRIYAYHDRADVTGNNDDAIYQEGFGSQAGYLPSHQRFFSPDEQLLREQDVAQIKTYLNEQKVIA